VLTDDMLTPKQLAKQYPVSRSTIYSACQEGLLPHYRLAATRGARGKYLIKRGDFLAWLEANRHEADEVEDDGKLTHIR
jgi:excisionase family DNA binding protein